MTSFCAKSRPGGTRTDRTQRPGYRGDLRQDVCGRVHPILGVLAGGDGAPRIRTTDAPRRNPGRAGMGKRRARPAAAVPGCAGWPLPLYHTTVAEFLTADKTRDNPDPKTRPVPRPRLLHEQIVVHMVLESSLLGVDWNDVDTYGLLHLAEHLSALQSDTGYRARLYELGLAVSPWRSGSASARCVL